MEKSKLSEVKSALRTVEIDRHIKDKKIMPLGASILLPTFKSKDLTELCDIARNMQGLLENLNPYGVYDLHAMYDEETEYWTGVLEERS
jgi:hypothetical protein